MASNSHGATRQGTRAYDEVALQRLLTECEVQTVNGSPVEVKAATDLPSGHLDPWVLQQQRAIQPGPGLVGMLRDLPSLVFSRNEQLLKGRASLEATMREDSPGQDLTSGAVNITRQEWDLAGETRPMWIYARTGDDSTPRPAFLHLHGGGFSAGTPIGNDPFLKVIADRSNAVIFDLDYSMIPERTFPQPVREAAAALSRIHDEASAWNVDPTRIAVGGGSAGANISAAAALYVRDQAHPPVALQVLYSPFLTFGGPPAGLSYQAAKVAKEHRSFAGPQSPRMMDMLTGMLYRTYRGKGGGRRDDPYMSPALAKDLRGLPAALIIAGEMDPLHQTAEHYAGDLARAGVRVRTIRYRGCLHDSVGQIGRVPQAEAAAIETVSAIEAMGRPV